MYTLLLFYIYDLALTRVVKSRPTLPHSKKTEIFIKKIV